MNDQPDAKYADVNDPDVTIRTDLWQTMDIKQLTNQHDLLLSRVAMMASMVNSLAPVAHAGMYQSMLRGLDQLASMIEYRTTNKN